MFSGYSFWLVYFCHWLTDNFVDLVMSMDAGTLTSAVVQLLDEW